MRGLRIAGFAAMLLLVAALAAFLWFRQASQPVHEGTVHVPLLQQAVRIERDEHGIPNVIAAGEHDAAFGLGYAHAQDRLWQMEMNRRVAAGRLSEILGQAALDTDRFLRTLGIRRAAERIYARIVRSNAAAALGGMDIFCLLPIVCYLDHGVIALIRKLNDEDPIDRLSPAKALGEIRDASAGEPLIATLGDRDCGNMAANALANIGKPSVESLCTVLKDDSTVARRNAATALGKIKDASAVKPLIAALKDEDLIVRRNAAISLGQIQDDGAVESLITALRDQNPIVRRNAAIALGQIKDANAVVPLIALGTTCCQLWDDNAD